MMMFAPISKGMIIILTILFSQTPARSVWDGVYTEVQAKRGEEMYSKSCQTCHDSSEFSGPGFMKQWSGHTAFDLFDEISAVMPKDAPGQLSKQTYVDIV